MQKIQTLVTSNQKELFRFLKFAIVGALGSVTDFTVLNTLIQVFDYGVGTANAISFSAAVVQNFFLNRYWTFPESRERPLGGQLMQFAIVNIVGLAINQVVFLTTHRLLEPTWVELLADPDLGFTISYNFAKLFAIGIVLFWNFGINRIWTYRGL